jgi:hypothetical protein
LVPEDVPGLAVMLMGLPSGPWVTLSDAPPGAVMAPVLPPSCCLVLELLMLQARNRGGTQQIQLPPEVHAMHAGWAA